jgi:hypothetical protein|tara:strand:- start:3882 stop:4106 length:225 start_codon:yes stop_codon:yes gene_type:complete
MSENAKWKEPDYITMDTALEDDDWGLIITASGDLKGLYIPKGKEEEEVPIAIQDICESFFGVDWEDNDKFQTIH